MSETKKYTVTANGFRHNGKAIPVGESVDLNDREAAMLSRINAVSGPEGSDMLEFAAVFERLGKDDFVKDGSPKVAAVSAAMGRKVTAEDLNAAWTAWKAAQDEVTTQNETEGKE